MRIVNRYKILIIMIINIINMFFVCVTVLQFCERMSRYFVGVAVRDASDKNCLVVF